MYHCKDKNAGICNIKKCGNLIKCNGGSTSSLHAHLKRKHNINLLKRELRLLVVR